jgi:sugar phosphate isomerase/epimerase
MRLGQTSRRGFIAGAASIPLLSACGQSAAPAPEPAPLPKTGIQLYTVRNALATDIPGTLRRLGEIGYKEVEGFGGLNPPVDELKTMLSDAGLTMPSAHVDRDRIRDNPGPEVERAAAMGYEYAVLNWLAPEERDTLDKYRAWADTANSFGEACRAAGLRFCWHNHDFELTAIDGVVPFDLLAERCDPELVRFELDLYWARAANVDLAAFLTQHHARIPMVHVKDMAADGAMADVGAGTIDFASLFRQFQFEHYYAERDDAPDPLVNAANMHAGLAAALEASRA